jgi:hypothetical protein
MKEIATQPKAAMREELVIMWITSLNVDVTIYADSARGTKNYPTSTPKTANGGSEPTLGAAVVKKDDGKLLPRTAPAVAGGTDIAIRLNRVEAELSESKPAIVILPPVVGAHRVEETNVSEIRDVRVAVHVRANLQQLLAYVSERGLARSSR